jgi:hypothetical protein
LVPPETSVGIRELEEFAGVSVDSNEERFTTPLRVSATTLARSGDCEVVLLGSIATGKYLDTLLPVVGERLLFPAEFVGRGDMSRGALLLRAAAANAELRYIPVLRGIGEGRPRISSSRGTWPARSQS